MTIDAFEVQQHTVSLEKLISQSDAVVRFSSGKRGVSLGASRGHLYSRDISSYVYLIDPLSLCVLLSWKVDVDNLQDYYQFFRIALSIPLRILHLQVQRRKKYH